MKVTRICTTTYKIASTFLALALLMLTMPVPRSAQLLASFLDSPAPTLDTVSPTEAYNYAPTTITITGTGFFTVTGTLLFVPQVRLNNAPLPDVTFVCSTTLTATVPADLPGGVYTVTVTNPDSQSASLVSAFTVLMSGDGSLGTWNTIYPQNAIERTNPTGIAVQSHLYIAGGQTNSGSTNSVEIASLNLNGTVETWGNGAAMVKPRSYARAFNYNEYMYVVGGIKDGGPVENSIEKSLINSDGSLSAWGIVTSPLNTERMQHAVAVVGNYVFVVGGIDGHGTRLRSVE